MWHPPTSESWCCTCHHCWPRPDPTKVWDIDLHCPWKPPEKTQLSKEPIWNSLLLPGMAWPTCPTNRCLGLPRVTKLPKLVTQPRPRFILDQSLWSTGSSYSTKLQFMLIFLEKRCTSEPQQVPPCHLSPTICQAQTPNRRCAAKVTSICSEVSVFVLAKAPQHQFLFFFRCFFGQSQSWKSGKTCKQQWRVLSFPLGRMQLKLPQKPHFK